MGDSDDAYKTVKRGTLKLKGKALPTKGGKKKKKKINAKPVVEDDPNSEIVEAQDTPKTAAEIAADAVRAKRKAEEIKSFGFCVSP
eukprot:GABW01002973.1.p2 GENE.GABW01002973.1~~GABW01002973.1.p2  ORF type:complete len:86 (+),score=16.80 GABW01002973.1:66-323(+)